MKKMNPKTKKTLLALLSLAAGVGGYVILGTINPLFVATDGLVEFLTDMM